MKERPLRVKVKQDRFETKFKMAVRTGLETMVVNKGCYGYYIIQSSKCKNRLL